ncbi:MAG: polysaccharide deacetylase family protein [Hyphomicrobiaceae bacterium]
MPISLAARAAAAVALLYATGVVPAAACTHSGRGLGVARIVEVDATGGPVFGLITKQRKENRFLGPKEAVLTFDDGPLPGVTRSILDTLDQFCTKATFFSVGRMAVAYPESIRDILKRGHTLGTHTWSHPMSLPRLSQKQARDQIESGFAAVSLAAGQPIAPFFRFPGLNDSSALVQHLSQRNIATFTVDVVSNDSYIADTQRLIDRTLAQLEEHQGGIMLFHDIKHQTARALPAILSEMKRRGYTIVHMRSKHPFVAEPQYVAAVSEHVAAKKLGPQKPALVAIVEQPAAPAPKEVAAVEPVAPRQPGPATTSETPAVHVSPTKPDVTARDATKPDIPSEALAKAAPVAAASAPEVPPVARPVARAAAPRPTPAAAPAVPLPATPPPQIAANPQPSVNQIEVVAGAYPNKPAAKPPVPAVPPPVAVQRTSSPERSWQEVYRQRAQEAGN